ncbi:hypothetical protein COOONC_11810 [Cooperia oncophora]
MICRYTVNDNGAYIYKCRQEGLLFYVHRSFQPGKPAANIVLAVEGLLILLVYTYTALMRRDFSKAFVAIAMAPFTLRAGVLLLHTAILHAMDFPDMNVLPYLLVLFLVFIVATLEVFPPTISTFDYSTISPLLFLAMLSLSTIIIAGLFVAMCIVSAVRSNTKHSTSSSDPVIVHALCRMFWTIPLMILACLASLIDLIGNLSVDPYFSTISMSILPPILLLSVFLLLPAYRTALFCCFANNRHRNRVMPLRIVVRPFSQRADSS